MRKIKHGSWKERFWETSLGWPLREASLRSGLNEKKPDIELGENIPGREKSEFTSHKVEASVDWRDIKKASGAAVSRVEKVGYETRSVGEAAVIQPGSN